MIVRLLIAGLLIVTTTFTHAQETDNGDFANYATKQREIFHTAYEKRDTIAYNASMNEFLRRYNLLAPAKKKEFAGTLSGGYYDLSCTYALLNNKKMALVNLEKAIHAGFYKYSHMLQDKDLKSIRKEEKFKKLIAPLRPIGDYLYILKRAAAFNTTDKRPLPAFTYQSPADTNLVLLRKTFRLDSIAGTGNEVSKILNVLHWLHNLVPHDGQHGIPSVRNAINLINVCKKDKRGLNCRGLATVLNECYLALGFKSRFVTCLPKDSLGVDDDCHVINMVYVPSLKKWIWVDPTIDGYWMNEKGELLSIAEVREKVITGKTLILNPDANWNRVESQTKADYLYNYMVKNLYMFECPVSSEYDLETGKTGKKIEYIRLVPLDYFKQKPDKKEINDGNNSTLVFYNTNNPDLFWRVPE